MLLKRHSIIPLTKSSQGIGKVIENLAYLTSKLKRNRRAGEEEEELSNDVPRLKEINGYGTFSKPFVGMMKHIQRRTLS